MTEDTTKPAAGGSPGGKTLAEIDADIEAANDEILKHPEWDPRSQQALALKRSLLEKRGAMMRAGAK